MTHVELTFIGDTSQCGHLSVWFRCPFLVLLSSAALLWITVAHKYKTH